MNKRSKNVFFGFTLLVVLFSGKTSFAMEDDLCRTQSHFVQLRAGRVHSTDMVVINEQIARDNEANRRSMLERELLRLISQDNGVDDAINQERLREFFNQHGRSFLFGTMSRDRSVFVPKEYGSNKFNLLRYVVQKNRAWAVPVIYDLIQRRDGLQYFLPDVLAGENTMGHAMGGVYSDPIDGHNALLACINPRDLKNVLTGEVFSDAIAKARLQSIELFTRYMDEAICKKLFVVEKPGGFGLLASMLLKRDCKGTLYQSAISKVISRIYELGYLDDAITALASEEVLQMLERAQPKSWCYPLQAVVGCFREAINLVGEPNDRINVLKDYLDRILAQYASSVKQDKE